MKIYSERMEILKTEIEKFENRIRIQDKEIENARLSAKSQFIEQTSKIESRIDNIENSLKNTPIESMSSGATINRVTCIPLEERIVVESGKSYDFCDTKWVLQIRGIEDGTVRVGSNYYNVPSTATNTGVDGCELQLLEIYKSDQNDFKAEIRGSCA